MLKSILPAPTIVGFKKLEQYGDDQASIIAFGSGGFIIVTLMSPHRLLFCVSWLISPTIKFSEGTAVFQTGAF